MTSDTYVIGDDAIYKNSGGNKVAITDSRLVISEIASDISSNKVFVTLEWNDWLGLSQKPKSSTILLGTLSNKNELLPLANEGAPINDSNIRDVMDYLKWACKEGNTKKTSVASSLGWNNTTFVIPGGNVQAIGIDESAWQTVGDAAMVKDALRSLISWGMTPALIVAAASVAAPFKKPLNIVRNPIISLAMESSTGKSTCTRFAISLFANPEVNKTLYRNNFTANGLMAQLVKLNDLPLAIDDVQNLSSYGINDLIYLLADGAEKLRASQTGAALNSNCWQGVAILSSEESVLADVKGKGAVNRSIVLTEPPLGLPKSAEGLERAKLLDNISNLHYGAIRHELSNLYSSYVTNSEVKQKMDSNFSRLLQKANEYAVPTDFQQQAALIGLGLNILFYLAKPKDASRDIVKSGV